jgi:hypothetical protein
MKQCRVQGNVYCKTRDVIDEEPPLSDLKNFQWGGTTEGSSMTYYYTQEERTSTLLYMYSNMEEMDSFFM